MLSLDCARRGQQVAHRRVGAAGRRGREQQRDALEDRDGPLAAARQAVEQVGRLLGRRFSVCVRVCLVGDEGVALTSQRL